MTVEFKNIEVIDDCIMFDAVTGKFHRISETAAFIINRIKCNDPVPQIITEYADKFSVPLTKAAREIELFMSDLFENVQ